MRGLNESNHVHNCFFKHIVKTGRGRGGAYNGEGESMGLIGPMVRVLADDNDADVCPPTEGEGGKYQWVGRVDDLLARGFLSKKGK